MALEVGLGNDPVQACRCPGYQAGPFLKKSCASCASMLIIRFVAMCAVDADPSRLVALRLSSCPFVDNSFLSLFPARGSF